MPRKKNGAKIRVFLNYRHTGQDPIIKVVKQLKEDSGLPEKEIKKRQGTSPSTSKNWFTGKTRNPQFRTIAEYAGAFGKRFVLEDANSTTPIIRNYRKSR